MQLILNKIASMPWAASLKEVKSVSFWLRKVAIHPCCWLPIVSGGSLQLLETHNLWLELSIGAVLVVVIEEAFRAVRGKFGGKCCHSSVHSSRVTSYIMSFMLFVAAFFISHQVFPHGDGHGHEAHIHAQSHIDHHAESTQEAHVDHPSHEHHDHEHEN